MKRCCRPLTSAGRFQTLYFLSSLSPVVLEKGKEMASACAQVEGAEGRLEFPALPTHTGWSSWEGASSPGEREHLPAAPQASPAHSTPPLSPQGPPKRESQWVPSECVKELKEPVPQIKQNLHSLSWSLPATPAEKQRWWWWVRSAISRASWGVLGITAASLGPTVSQPLLKGRPSLPLSLFPPPSTWQGP